MSVSSPAPSTTIPARPATIASSRKGSFKASSARASSTAGGDEETFAVAVLQWKSKPGAMVGIAVLGMKTGKTTLTQFTDGNTFARTKRHLHLYPPNAIIVPEGMPIGEGRLNLASVLQDLEVDIEAIERTLWNKEDGAECVKRFIVHDRQRASTLNGVMDHGLYHWLTSKGIKFSAGSLPIRFHASDGTMFIDMQTAKDLELVSNALTNRTDLTLFSTLNNCCTRMGARLLRSNILQPFTEKALINHRLDAITELGRAPGSSDRLRNIRKAMFNLKSIDLDNIIAQFSQRDITPVRQRNSETQIALLLNLKTTLATVRELQTSLVGCSAPILTVVYENLVNDDMLDIEATIDERIHDNRGQKNRGAGRGLPSKNDRLFAVRQGVDRLLDVARTVYCDTRTDIDKMAEDISEIQGVTCKSVWTRAGFRFGVARTDETERLPQEYINKEFSKKQVLFATHILMIANSRLRQAEEEILALSLQAIVEMEDVVIRKCGSLYECSEALGVLDVIQSLAYKADFQSTWCRPTFSDKLAINNGRHPILEKRLARDCIPNNVYAATGSSHFQLVQGPNMSGKSTYLRQIGLLTVQAMIGSYIPADYASFRLHDALLTRLSNDDSMEKSLSTFAAEMSSAAVILGIASGKSLVLIDELGRGTAPQEGIGISFAIGEQLVNMKAYVFFATHFTDLAAALSPLPGVVNLHLSVEDNASPGGDDEFTTAFKYKVIEGLSPAEHYGLETAKLASLPPSVMLRATDVASRLNAIEQNGRNANPVNAIAARRKALLELRGRLKQIAETSKLDDRSLAIQLRSLQDETLGILVKAIEAEKQVRPNSEYEP